MSKDTLRDEIEKILQKEILDKQGEGKSKEEWFDNATSQILELFESVIPKEKKFLTKQRQTGKSQALFDINIQTIGYNQCIADMREKMK